ncbi:endo-1,4-beta-xylanase [Motilibacter peucedani]|uniref:Beta-xylanase n=1 Tax=Motilibacter peucedani TaxID=598650 RepID=A0A420XT50_9ACTN|nr:endo-1,4-beta-xylanase [Motilibacter peucedani]RKS80006.1 endo-1,4-beta-xylanase [Motilibacter peucedani]
MPALRRSVAIGVISAAAVAAAPLASAIAASPATAATAKTSSASANAPKYPKDSLRELGQKVGLRIGAALNPDLLGTDAAYTKIAKQQFSTVTPENVMKWEVVEPAKGTYDWSGGDKLVDFAHANHQRVRGHNLVWHSQLPKWLTPDGFTTTYSSAQLKAILKKHVQDEARHFKGKIWQWDVVNEAFNDDGTPREDIWYKAYGNLDYIADAFTWAHQADPKALLFYNDYNIEFTGPKSNAVYSLVKKLKARGVPIQGVGFQTHLDTQYPYPDLRANLTRFAALGVYVAETEVDVRTFTKPDAMNTPVDGVHESAQVAYWSRTIQDCLSVKACISYTPWGFGDAYSWVPGVFAGEGAALLYDEQLQPKQAYTVIQQDLELADGATHRSHSQD